MTRDKALALAVSAWTTPETSNIEMDSKLAWAFAAILFNAVNQPQPANTREKGMLKPHPTIECPACHKRVKGIFKNGRVYPFRHNSRWHKPCPGWTRKVEG